MDSSAIIWGVGNNSLHLPIPKTCPEGFKLLVKQCFSSKPRNRPSFKIILTHLDIASVELMQTFDDKYVERQKTWREEIVRCFKKIKILLKLSQFIAFLA